MKRYGKEVHLYVLKRVQNNLVPTHSMKALKTEYTAELMLKREPHGYQNDLIVC